MRLLVRNLSRSTTEAELKELFEQWGRVQSCTIVLDAQNGRSKGFGFVDMPKAGDAKVAVRNLNGTDVDGQRIRVKNAKPKSNADDAAKTGEAGEPSSAAEPTGAGDN